MDDGLIQLSRDISTTKLFADVFGMLACLFWLCALSSFLCMIIQ